DGVGAIVPVGPGLGDLPALRAVGRRLPESALARLYVNPRQIGRLLSAAPRPAKPTDARLMAIVERYLAAGEFAGAALDWNNRTITVHTVETFDPPRLDPWLRHWAGATRERDQLQDRVPPGAVALVSGHVDAIALFDALAQLVPDEDRGRMGN